MAYRAKELLTAAHILTKIAAVIFQVVEILTQL